MTFLGWLSDPFKGLSDLQLGDEKGTLNHLVDVSIIYTYIYMSYFRPYLGKIPILTNIFLKGLVQPPTSCLLMLSSMAFTIGGTYFLVVFFLSKSEAKRSS